MIAEKLQKQANTRKNKLTMEPEAKWTQTKSI